MILSEIIFDSYHHRAALNVTVSCIGGGYSETHVYKLHRGNWTHSADADRESPDSSKTGSYEAEDGFDEEDGVAEGTSQGGWVHRPDSIG